MLSLRARLHTTACAVLLACGIAAPSQAQSWAESWFDNVTYTQPGQGGDGAAIPERFEAQPGMRSRFLDNLSCDFWLDRAATSGAAG